MTTSGFQQGRQAATPDEREAGFTLVELLMVTVIAPLVAGAILVSTMSIFNLQAGAAKRLSGATNAQIVTATFTHDIQSATSISTSSSLSSCGSGGTQILATKSNQGAVSTSYAVVASGTKYNLVRRLCSISNGVATLSSVLTVSSDVPSTQTASITCASTIVCTYSTGWIATGGIKSVTISVTEPNTGAAYSLTAVPRTWSELVAGLQVDPFPITPLMLLNTAACPQSLLTDDGVSNVNVGSGNGVIAVNSTCANTVALSGSSTIEASQITTANSALTTVNKPASLTAPTQVFASGGTPDPLASLKAPTEPTTSTTGACPATTTSGVFTSGNWTGTCSPGNYASAVTISNSNRATFTAGTYVFTGKVTIGGAATASFGAGTYWFKGGLELDNSAQVTFGTGTYIFGTTATTSSTTVLSATGAETLNGAAAGNLFYIEGGAVNVNNSASVSLSGLASFDGIAIWAATSSSPLSLGGAGCVGATYGGIYAPHSKLTVQDSGNMTASFVIADSLALSGAATLVVG